MKLAKGITLLAMAGLLIAITGCKSTQGITPLPGNEPMAANQVGLGLGPGDQWGPNEATGADGNIPMTGSFPGWIEDREMFAAQTIYFDFDKSNVKASEVPKLEIVARQLSSMPNRALRIEGHCDERGTEEYNRSLGERRALSVREVLVGLGVAPGRVETVTFGEDRPVDGGHNESAWSRNRRGEIIALSPPGQATAQP